LLGLDEIQGPAVHAAKKRTIKIMNAWHPAPASSGAIGEHPQTTAAHAVP
jgi:hypothetical protein